MNDDFSNIDTTEDDAAKAAADGLPFEDTPPISEPPMTGEPDHDEAEDDTEEDDRVLNGEEEPHPAHPATYPIPPKASLTVTVKLSVEELAEKGKMLGNELRAVKELQKKRTALNAQIKSHDDRIEELTAIVTTGSMEVPAEQQDLLRQPVGGQAAAAEFTEMARAAEQSSQEGAAAVQGDDQAVADLNQMAQDIQAGKPGTEPSAGFLNDIENHKAKSAAKRKGAKVAG